MLCGAICLVDVVTQTIDNTKTTGAEVLKSAINGKILSKLSMTI